MKYKLCDEVEDQDEDKMEREVWKGVLEFWIGFCRDVVVSGLHFILGEDPLVR